MARSISLRTMIPRLARCRRTADCDRRHARRRHQAHRHAIRQLKRVPRRIVGIATAQRDAVDVAAGLRDRPSAPNDFSLFVPMSGNYSVTKAPEQSTRPSCSPGLCRFTLVKRFAEFCASGKLGRLTAMSWCCLSVTHTLLTSD